MPDLVQQSLYFGRNIERTGLVSEEQFQTFLDTVVTPRFPNGLTVINADGQYLDQTNTLIEEPSKIVTVFADDNLVNTIAIREIVEDYLQEFNQETVLQVANSDDIKVSFELGKDIIQNDPTPELIQVDLYFGRDIPGGGQVSDAQFQTFLDTEITPRFPDGLTVFNANGQYLDNSNTLIEEPSKSVTLIVEDTQANETEINEIIQAYLQQFNQESVLVSVNEDVKVSFGIEFDLIENDATPELIKANLFFGRNIPGGGEVSDQQFQTFLDTVITPRFPNGLTVVDAQGQYLDNSNTLIEEPSKAVTLILEDTETNETAINNIIQEYLQQFNQESVLTLIDEEIGVRFDPVNIVSVLGTPQGDTIEQNLLDEVAAILGLGGDDQILATINNSFIFGNAGQDRIQITNTTGNNKIYGGQGNDDILLGSNDRVWGDAGSDRFFTQTGGGNRLTGGEGSDQFWIANNGVLPSSANTITDFLPGTDVLGFQGFDLNFNRLTLTTQNGNTIISASSQNIAILEGISPSQINSSSFVFE